MPFIRAIAQQIRFTTRIADGTPTVPTNPVATIDLDAAGFGATTNAVVSLTGGACELSLTAAEMTADRITVIVASDNCVAEHVHIFTESDFTPTRAALLDNLDAAITSLNDLAAADVLTQVGTALNTAIGVAPTAGSINERIKALDDAYTAARAAYLDSLGATDGPTYPKTF